MRSRKGLAITAAGNLVLLIAITLFVLFIVYAMYSGFSTPKDAARVSAAELAGAIARVDSVSYQQVRVDLDEDWWLNFDSPNERVQVYKNDDLNREFQFEFPPGYDNVCCPEKLDEAGYCAQHCPDTAILGQGKKVDVEFCVSTQATLMTTVGGSLGELIPSSHVVIYPKTWGTCTEMIETAFGAMAF